VQLNPLSKHRDRRRGLARIWRLPLWALVAAASFAASVGLFIASLTEIPPGSCWTWHLASLTCVSLLGSLAFGTGARARRPCPGGFWGRVRGTFQITRRRAASPSHARCEACAAPISASLSSSHTPSHSSRACFAWRKGRRLCGRRAASPRSRPNSRGRHGGGHESRGSMAVRLADTADPVYSR